MKISQSIKNKSDKPKKYIKRDEVRNDWENIRLYGYAYRIPRHRSQWSTIQVYKSEGKPFYLRKIIEKHLFLIRGVNKRKKKLKEKKKK